MVDKGLSRQQIYKNGWLNIKTIYRQEGWIVEFEKPDYNGPGEPYFTFRIRRTKRK